MNFMLIFLLSYFNRLEYYKQLIYHVPISSRCSLSFLKYRWLLVVHWLAVCLLGGHLPNGFCFLFDGLPWISLHPGMDSKNFWMIFKQLLIVLHLHLLNDSCYFVWSFFPQLAYFTQMQSSCS